MKKNNSLLFLVNDVLLENNGVAKKVLAQSEAFSTMFNEYYFCHLNKVKSKGFVRLVNNVNLSVIRKSKLCFLFLYRDLLDFVLENKLDVVYIRYAHFSSPFFMFFLYKLKSNNVRVLLEFPTYPYDLEYKHAPFLSKCRLFMDQLFRIFLRFFVTESVTFSGEDYVLGIKAHKISNAAPLPIVKRKDNTIQAKPELSEIHFVAVANLGPWHGYDRLIKSISNYYKLLDFSDENVTHKKVMFHIVGDGLELSHYKDICRTLGIEEYIVFHGEMSGENLSVLLNKCDIGVDSLGRHRSGNNVNNSLKSKEYLLHGLPIVKSHIDLSLDNNKFCSYVFNVAPTDDDFDISDIIKWYIGMEHIKISDLAEENFTWESQLRSIFYKP